MRCRDKFAIQYLAGRLNTTCRRAVLKLILPLNDELQKPILIKISILRIDPLIRQVRETHFVACLTILRASFQSYVLGHRGCGPSEVVTVDQTKLKHQVGCCSWSHVAVPLQQRASDIRQRGAPHHKSPVSELLFYQDRLQIFQIRFAVLVLDHSINGNVDRKYNVQKLSEEASKMGYKW